MSSLFFSLMRRSRAGKMVRLLNEAKTIAIQNNRPMRDIGVKRLNNKPMKPRVTEAALIRIALPVVFITSAKTSSSGRIAPILTYAASRWIA